MYKVYEIHSQSEATSSYHVGSGSGFECNVAKVDLFIVLKYYN